MMPSFLISFRLRSLAPLGALAAASLVVGAPLALEAQDPPRTVQPGAPGSASRVVTAEEARRAPGHDAADVHFMQMMIAHHAQALEMSELAPDRAEREDVLLLARRIHLAQFDEIRLMAQWLRDRGAEVPPEAAVAGVEPGMGDHGDHAGHAGHAGHTGHGDHAGHAGHTGHAGHAGHGDPKAHDHGDGEAHDHASMPGMLSPEQLAELAASSGAEFDRRFLEFMIFHHEGAILMVKELFDSPAGGQESEIFQFAAHVDSDQRIEIDRMRAMLARGTDAP